MAPSGLLLKSATENTQGFSSKWETILATLKSPWSQGLYQITRKIFVSHIFIIEREIKSKIFEDFPYKTFSAES